MKELIEKIVERLKKEVYRIDDSATLSTRDVINEEDVFDIIQEEAKAYNESVKTNADYIRNMTDDELANLLEDVRTHGFTDLCCNDSLCDSDGCDDCIRAWLKAEREG